jgi:hypothetical protein
MEPIPIFSERLYDERVYVCVVQMRGEKAEMGNRKGEREREREREEEEERGKMGKKSRDGGDVAGNAK